MSKTSKNTFSSVAGSKKKDAAASATTKPLTETQGVGTSTMKKTRHSRRLVEDYWRSVLQTKGEPPLYHTFSHRYGGAHGVPFAARTDTSAVLPQDKQAARNLSVDECMTAAQRSIEASDLPGARSYLEQALTKLQNTDGGMTLAALTTTVRAAKEEAGATNSSTVAKIFLELSKIELLDGNCDEALRLLDLSCEAEPLTPAAYVLRASCYEKKQDYPRAFEEYEKYMRLSAPSLDVLAHCGKCAAEGGATEAAEKYLLQLLAAAERNAASDDRDKAAVAAFYAAHAHFYLGYLCELQAHEPDQHPREAAALRVEAVGHYAQARANEGYVVSYENNVEDAIASADYKVALRLLQYLQKMSPDNADNFLSAAHVCHLMEDTEGEWVALSEALARAQSSSARRATVLARGMVFAEKVKDYSRAIRDFTIAINIIPDEAQDHCTPIAYLNRAEAFRSREKTTASTSPQEDRSASLDDYRRFVESVQEIKTAEGCTDADICDPQCITDAMIILAAGAFEQENYRDANTYFSTAITRGWRPLPPHEALAALAAEAEVVDVDLYDKAYLAAAHCVIEDAPPVSDPFKVAYAPREWSSGDSKRPKTADKRDADRGVMALPSLLFLVLDAHYTQLRALEPTMFTKLENQFLTVWDPYRTEMNRRKEEASGARGARRTKRHAT